jgi:ketosteroid isomerase-like protein
LDKFAPAFAVSIIAAAAPSPARVPCSADSADGARAAISSALEAWRMAFNERDESRVCELFAPDLIANYQGQPERDYTALCDLLTTSVRDTERTYHYSFNISEILVFGTTAIVRLVWTLEIKKGDAREDLIKEPAIDIFRCQDDGSWKISRYLAYPATP